MSLNRKEQLNKAEPTGRTIARTNARLITTEEANAVGGGALTSSRCICCCGVDYGGYDS